MSGSRSERDRYRLRFRIRFCRKLPPEYEHEHEYDSAQSEGMVVYPDRMRENLARSRGVVFSGQILLELASRGIAREQAYSWVQRNAMRSFDEQRPFKELLLADHDVMAVLTPSDIEKAFDLHVQLRHVDEIIDRVFKIQQVPTFAHAGERTG